jgi:hypothetical protein
MAQGNSELWKQAYRAQYGNDPEQDMPEHQKDIEEWRTTWQNAYDAGEQWAKDMLGPQADGAGQPGGSSGAQSANPMRTFADMSQQNARIREQYDTWRDQRAAQGQDATDWDAFRTYVTGQGSPDPGGRPPDDFVGDDFKQQHPEWVQRYSNRVA